MTLDKKALRLLKYINKQPPLTPEQLEHFIGKSTLCDESLKLLYDLKYVRPYQLNQTTITPKGRAYLEEMRKKQFFDALKVIGGVGTLFGIFQFFKA